MYAQFVNWLESTPLSTLFKVTFWVVPVMQSIHILAIGVVFASGVIIALRVAGISARHVAIASLNDRLIPWVWWSLLVLLSTGVILIITEPGRALTNPFFLAKLACIVVAVAVMLGFQRAVRRNPLRWSGDVALPWGARSVAGLVVLLLLAIIFCGRFIAYYNVTD
jgi:hypothetical protein